MVKEKAMALRGALTHRKTRRLARFLGIPVPFALGIMEALWHVAGEQQIPDGAVGRLSDEDLAMEMFYDGDPAALVRALMEAELLDRHPVHRLIVHDWHELSDDTTDNRLARMRRRYANGAMPRMKRLSREDRERITASFAQEKAENWTCHEKPLPEPEPEPEPVPEILNPLPLVNSSVDEEIHDADEGCDDYALPVMPDSRDTKVVPIRDRHGLDREVRPNEKRMRAREAPEGVEQEVWVAAVDSVMLACDSCDRKTRGAVERAMHLAIAKARERGNPLWPDEIAERMAAARREFLAEARFMRYPVGVRSFYGDELWANSAAWPWDRRKLDNYARARVGSYG